MIYNNYINYYVKIAIAVMSEISCAHYLHSVRSTTIYAKIVHFCAKIDVVDMMMCQV